MTRSELKEWLETCPNKDWFQAADDGQGVRIYFPVDEDPVAPVDPPDLNLTKERGTYED